MGVTCHMELDRSVPYTTHAMNFQAHAKIVVFSFRPIYTVSQKRDPDIIDCNFGKD